MTSNTKDKCQYITAIIGFFSGVVMCYLSFFLNHYCIDGSVLGYTGLMISFAGAVFGISVYARKLVGDMESDIKDYVDSAIKKSKKE